MSRDMRISEIGLIKKGTEHASIVPLLGVRELPQAIRSQPGDYRFGSPVAWLCLPLISRVRLGYLP
jgi:hypothetical protein